MIKKTIDYVRTERFHFVTGMVGLVAGMLTIFQRFGVMSLGTMFEANKISMTMLGALLAVVSVMLLVKLRK